MNREDAKYAKTPQRETPNLALNNGSSHASGVEHGVPQRNCGTGLWPAFARSIDAMGCSRDGCATKTTRMSGALLPAPCPLSSVREDSGFKNLWFSEQLILTIFTRKIVRHVKMCI